MADVSELKPPFSRDKLHQMLKMQWTLIVATLYSVGSSSVVLAAPQDVLSGDVSQNTAKYRSMVDTTTITPENLPEDSQSTENESEEPNMYSEQRANSRATTEVQKQQPAEAVVAENSTPITITITRPTKKPNKKPKPVRATTTAATTTTTVVTTLKPAVQQSAGSSPTRRYPCVCGGGLCSCCTGIILENFNVPFRSRACANVTYDPDDFAFNFKLLYNDRLLYNNRLSAKNPPPACITVNRYFGVKMCAKMTNVFLSGRNMHACLEMEGFWDDEPAFNYPFNCFRFGSEGVAVVRPEDGGGLPPPPDAEEPIDEYDDNVRGFREGWTADVLEVPN